MSESSNTRIHPTAIIEPGVSLGPGTSVWDSVHIRRGATLGEECIVGEKTYIAYDVKIGHRVKLNAFVYICYGVTIEDGVMISAGTVFTNDVFPRATTPDLLHLRPSDPDDETQETIVSAGATIGAGCTIGSNLRIGRFAMVGMGSVVTRSVADFFLVVGNPARSIGAVCKCGHVVARWAIGEPPQEGAFECPECGAAYHMQLGVIVEAATPPTATPPTATVMVRS
jgi:UDP-2-acetamido-3-amino-2,3-dideoxy-glucuronate N-acetyltransferase